MNRAVSESSQINEVICNIFCINVKIGQIICLLWKSSPRTHWLHRAPMWKVEREILRKSCSLFSISITLECHVGNISTSVKILMTFALGRDINSGHVLKQLPQFSSNFELNYTCEITNTYHFASRKKSWLIFISEFSLYWYFDCFACY